MVTAFLKKSKMTANIREYGHPSDNTANWFTKVQTPKKATRWESGWGVVSNISQGRLVHHHDQGTVHQAPA